jgi:uncharacterized protein (TIGR00730 family)
VGRVESVCVYCGSSNTTDPDYLKAAADFGRILAKNGVRMVYGGGGVGLMGACAKAAHNAGGKVLGVMPNFLRAKEILYDEVETIVVQNMHERKRIMFERADSFAALPGGLGTLEEVVEIATWAQLERHAKPVLMINIGGFWDPLIALFRRMTDDGFLRKPFLSGPDLPIRFCADVADVIPTLNAALAEAAEAAPATQSSARVRRM